MNHGHDKPRKVPLDLGMPVFLFQCPPRVITSRSVGLLIPAAAMRNGSMPWPGGVEDQPNAIVEAVDVIAQADAEKQRFDKSNRERKNA